MSEKFAFIAEEKSTHTKVCFENSIDMALVVFKFSGTNEKRAENEQKLEDKILELIQSNPNISRKNISIEIGILSTGGVNYYLEKLKKEGRIKRIGSAKGGRWIIVEP